jgi:hypothetical protein
VLQPGVRRLPVLQGKIAAASAVPMIDWGGINSALDSPQAEFGADSTSWVANFVNNVGRNAAAQPNAGLRIKPPTS